ncbi:MAG: hypothetical protein H6747_04655 [Deltaproteobacteria bacterium]|nr:hypothetical protein [Deltaproteobacteria bacterium]
MALTTPHPTAELAASLPPTSELAKVSATQLARRGTETLRNAVESESSLRVQIQGQDALVVMPRSRYEQIRAALAAAAGLDAPDPMLDALNARFDELVAQMATPSTAAATHDVLFADPAALASTYAPGETEGGDDASR